MPVRTYNAGSVYRYGFNGKENDNEVKGIEGSQQDFGMRIYDPRLGRFLSVDPIGGEFPWNSVYAFAENDPVNHIDLDGLEKASPPQQGGGRGGSRGGRGRRVTGLNSYAEELANGVGAAARANRIAREELARERHLRRYSRDPIYRQKYDNQQAFVQSVSRENYIRSSYNSASSVFGTGGNVRDNHKAGQMWDDFVHATMLKNPSYIGVARQVSLKVTATVNGQTIVANIRVDNVGISKDASGKVLFNLVEAKYSINDITINNVKQTLTPQQKTTEYILLKGKDVQFFIRGAGSASVLTQGSASAGTAFSKDQNISGNISGITVVVPGANSNTNQSNPPTTTTKSPKNPL